MRKVTLIDIFNPTKLRDWLNELASTGGAKGEKGDTGAKGEKGVGIKTITSSQEGNTITVTITMTDNSTQNFTFNAGTTQ